LVVVINELQIKGVVTDGDLRRALVHHVDINQARVIDIMTEKPISISSDTMLIDAEALMLKKKIKALLVADTNNNLIGILEIFDR